MALTRYALTLLAEHLPGKRVLSLGYPDLVVRAEDIREIFGVEPTQFADYGAWHGVAHPLPETYAVFEAIGASLDCIDIRQSRGVERVVDLNHACALGAYDIVIDPGTVEHCFNIGQAIMNAANAVAPQGRVFHISPLTMMNHGFYNINPTLLSDFYTQNGWTIETLVGVVKGGVFKVPSAQPFRAVPERASLYCMARRDSCDELRFPTQAKYLANPDLA